jgi:4-amino-4-deoxy-L-arabinose transferase-like glycosyltransferase
MQRKFPGIFRYGWVWILITALIWRGLILASGGVSFHSDEAIVGLMARHINQGQPIPTFFYGQAYMGSLDALLVAGMFRLAGESVLSIRLVQSLLYAGTLLTTLALALRLTGSRTVALLAGLLIALPPVALTLYTTVSLGGYGETLLLGNLIVLTGYEIAQAQPRSWRRWLLLGACTGLGWWTNNLIVLYAIPVGLILLRKLRRAQLPMLAGAFAAFLLFGAPWWLYNLNHDWASIRFLLNGYQYTGSAVDRLISLTLIGLPTLAGVRFPWAPEFWIGAPLALIILVLNLTVLALSALGALRKPGRARFLWGILACFVLIFVLSNFGGDSTGRYLLPFFVVLALLYAIQARAWGRWGIALVAVWIGINALGTITALRTTGLTTQIDAITEFSNTYDQAVIAFLREHGRYGYATYWVAYRLDFLSGESVILSASLPYKADMLYFDTDRYPAYTEAVNAASRPVFVTANHPALDAGLIKQFAATGVESWKKEAIGPYTVFYDLSKHATPADLGFVPAAP